MIEYKAQLESLLADHGISHSKINFNLGVDQLYAEALSRGEGALASNEAMVVSTGKFTGRSPKDKFTVKDAITENAVHWNDFNIPIEEKYFLQLKDKMLQYLTGKEIWVRDCYACADEKYKLSLRVINEQPSAN